MVVSHAALASGVEDRVVRGLLTTDINDIRVADRTGEANGGRAAFRSIRMQGNAN
jgi:hypothetical protein